MRDSVTTLDLFCGAGGLSQGFELYNRGNSNGSGWPSVNYEVVAGLDMDSSSLETFYKNHPNANRAFSKPLDLSKRSGKDILSALGLREIDMVVGGPPCQGFSVAGPRNPRDARNALVYHFVRLVGEMRPTFFVMENVPGLLRTREPDEDPFFVQLLDKFENAGFATAWFALNAMDYGVPQKRKRVVVVGNRFGLDLPRPEATHGEQLDLFLRRKPFVTVRDALFDLPSPTHEEPQEYALSAHSDYARFMREGSEVLYNHTPAKHKAGQIEKMRRQKPGSRLYDGWNHAWIRLDPDKPAPTVKENHRAPAVHPSEPRIITPRECARLQSFPDTFVFAGTKTAQLMQIGNAVPPLLGRAIARIIAEGLLSAAAAAPAQGT